MSEQEYTFQPERFSGEIIVCEERVPISFEVSADLGGRLDIVVDAVSVTSASRKIITSIGEAGTVVKYFCLEGESDQGKKISSNRAYLYRFDHSSGVFEIEIKVDEVTITFDSNEPLRHTTFVVYLLGFECFGSPREEATIGRVAAYAETIAKNKHHIGGHIVVQAAHHVAESDWLLDAEDLLQHVRLALAFARGARLSAPIVRTELGSQISLKFFRDSVGHGSKLPIISHLNLEPIFKSSVQSYEATRELKDTLESAVGWLLIPTTYDEVQFLSGMTSLEVLTARFLTNREKTLVNNATFQKLSKKIRHIIDTDTALESDVKEEFSKKLVELKRKSFREKIVKMYENLEVSRTDLSDNVIQGLISTRNKIVHQGIDTDEDKLWEKNLILRELLVRVVLTLFQYIGPYNCYIGGRHVRHFPSCKRAE